MKRLLTILDSLQEQVEVKEKPQDRVSDAPPQREDSVHAHIIPNLVPADKQPDYHEPVKDAGNSQASHA
jgi:hypothetical protein